MSQPEEWRPIVDWPGYEVSSLGRVRSLTRALAIERSHDGAKQGHSRSRSGRVLNTHQHQNGYLTVRLSPGGKNCLVHRLVCRAFHGAAPSPDYHADHLNRVRSDNCAHNLRWLAPEANRALRDFARGERSGSSKLTARSVQKIFLLSKRVGAAKVSDAKIAAEYGVRRETVREIRRGKTWSHITSRIHTVENPWEHTHEHR